MIKFRYNLLVKRRLSSSLYTKSKFSSSPSWTWESANGLLSLLTDKQRALLDEQRKLTLTAIDMGKRVGGVNLQHCTMTPFLQHILTPEGDNDTAAQIDREDSNDALNSTFSVVVAGEFNSGKSTLINALLGQKLLETGALPTTDTITVLSNKPKIHNSASQTSVSINNNNVETRTSHSNAITLHRIPNSPLLQDLTLIDTPGTNAILTNHTTRTLKLLPSADLILFVTSVDRPFPESDRKLLQSIQAYRKNIVIVVNKMDILDASGGNHGEIEKKKVMNFIADNAANLLGARAIILSVSARDALSAKLIHGGSDRDKDQIDSSKMWKRSNFASIEMFLKETLTEETKVQAKLLNPLGVTDGMLSECFDVLKSRSRELETDIATVNLLENQMDSWKKDMDGDIDQFRNDVRDHLQKEMNRCRYLVNSIGIVEMYTVVLVDDRTILNTKWEDTKSVIVSDNVHKEILESVHESTDAIATSARAQGQAVIEYLGKRPAVVGKNLIGNVTAASRFENTRKDLYERISKVVTNVLATYDPEKEKEDVFSSLRNTVYISSALNVVGVTTGLCTFLEFVDITTGGLVTCGLTIASIGVISSKNRKTVKDFEDRWEQRHGKLNDALDTLCSKEVQRIHKRILDGVSPYTRYVNTEKENLEKMTEECNALMSASQSLRNRILKLR